MGGLRLFYSKRLLDYEDVAQPLSSNPEQLFDVPGEPVVAASSSFLHLHPAWFLVSGPSS